jgi:hypothetical protein
MTNPIDLSLQAAHLWLRAASLTWKAAVLPLEVSARVAGAMCERALAVRERSEVPEPVGVAVTEPTPATGPSPKQRSRAARREPTSGQAAQQRSARREAEAREAQETDTAPHAGAEVEVAEPWEGYDALSAADVVQRLVDVDDTTRAAVRLYENTHEGREAILHATD